MIDQEKVTQITGKLYYKIFLAGANKIMENQALLNRINVFPVPDADTGTNLANTLRAVIDNAQPSKSFQQTADAIAVAALNGARGNSGVIFAQFLYGVSIETQGNDVISISKFADAIKKSIKHIYNAVSEPVEGTMLTVIREWADFIYAQKENFDDFIRLFLDAIEIAKKSLIETTSQLKSLSIANVVDAGGQGFVLFLEGIMEGFRKKATKREIIVSIAETPILKIENTDHENIKFRYCSETLIKGEGLHRDKIKALISDLGDSLVIAGSDKMSRIHIHTDHPHILFEKLSKLGTLNYQKAEDMVMQNQVAKNRKYKIALVTDSTSDISPELIEDHQIHVVPLNIHFGENQYLDKLTIKPDQFFKMLRTNSNFPTTSQPNAVSFENLYSLLASNYDSVISVHISEKFSGTYNSARKAAEKVSKELGKQITVLDSRHVSGSLGLLTMRMAEEIKKGKKHDEIVNEFEGWREKARIYVSVKNLKNMVRGGRVSPAKGVIANLLNVKPIVSVDKEGNSLLFDKAFSQKKNMKKVMKHAAGFLEGQKLWNYQVLHAENETVAQWFIDEMKNLTGKDPLAVLSISPVIGLSAGEGTAAIAIMIE